jgi:hypothetical protein
MLVDNLGKFKGSKIAVLRGVVKKTVASGPERKAGGARRAVIKRLW